MHNQDTQDQGFRVGVGQELCHLRLPDDGGVSEQIAAQSGKAARPRGTLGQCGEVAGSGFLPTGAGSGII